MNTMDEFRDKLGKLIYETYNIIAPGLLDKILLLLFSVNDCLKMNYEEEVGINYGASMMASQIRKSIEQETGRFSNEDANWILDRISHTPVSLNLEWEMVKDCHALHHRSADATDTICHICNGSGKIYYPIKFENLDWNEIFKLLYIFVPNFLLQAKIVKKGE